LRVQAARRRNIMAGDDNAIRRFYESPEYRATRAARAGAAQMNVISVAGA